MKITNTVISVLLLSAACATPAFANYFANPALNVRLNIGSAPNPTVHDIRTQSMPLMTHQNQPTRNVTSTVVPVPHG